MKALKYSDIVLIPSYTECESRSDCGTSVEICGKKYKLPVIPANMKAVISERHCEWMSANDYFYIMHRFDVDIQAFVDDANRNNWTLISISLGVKQADRDLVNKFQSSGSRVDFITIDIAHGHSSLMRDMINYCKLKLPDTNIIAGNVATPRGVKDLAAWGADIVKVGIAQGSPCTTKDKTGFTVPMFTCVQQCSNLKIERPFLDELGDVYPQDSVIPIIADGGASSNGDISKALVAGADLVMAGGLFARCSDSPSHSIDINGVLHKAYYGSASFENKKTRSHIEGTLKHVSSCGIPFRDKFIEVEEDLQSSISYAGGRDISVLNSKDVEYMEV
jgi:GMP reductase